ncbi:MAG: sodium:calcium antiporter [Rhodospirillaceae bacterium]|nr:sodium:calcium antiporter [Alphaproteobacteria bacterium]MBR71382.1 sodium:calcium antiporter [Rhodospirillaceae bacterium]|tara:strand:- start:8044 stop:9012 length:969 start_codon:yes stop_codon:yes gene_type:complete
MTIDVLTWVALFGGMLLLFFGGEILVRGAVGLAQKLGVSPLLIGATVVAFGTSAPELVVSIDAAIQGVVDVAIGNVFGSNLANLLLILGISVALTPIIVEPKFVRRDSAALLLTTIAVVGLAFLMEIPWYLGLIMILVLIAHVTYGYWKERNLKSHKVSIPTDLYQNLNVEYKEKPIWLSSFYLFLGILGVIFGAHFLVDSGTNIARAVGISEAVIGLTVVALGTSLPELATSIMAAIKRHGDVALGNILGSSLFNILGILGAVALVRPAPIPQEIVSLDLWILLGVTLIVFLPVYVGWRLGRFFGILLLILYIAYIVHHFM